MSEEEQDKLKLLAQELERKADKLIRISQFSQEFNKGYAIGFHEALEMVKELMINGTIPSEES